MVQLLTDSGPVLGEIEGGITVLRGVPYARAARFGLPEPPPPWTSPRDARRPGPACPQPDGPLGRPVEGTDEDCLVLNVWTPGLDDGARPVLVFLHGGGFTTGSGAVGWYDGRRLAARGAVVVTVNYRLGVLGWLLLDGVPGAPAGSGNAGLVDQLAALRWVRAHAERLGGDPDRICLVGQSAGAMGAATLLGTAEGARSVRRVICQSGAQHHVRNPEAAVAVTASVLDRLGIASPTIEDLRRVPVQALLAAQSAGVAANRHAGGLPFGPVVDGSVLHQHPAVAIEAGVAAGVDLVCGVTSEEMRFFSAFGRRDLSEDRFEARVAALVAAATGGADADPDVVHHLADGYRRLLPEARPADRWDLLQGDHVFGLPAQRLVDRQARHGRSWSYLFTYRGAGSGGRLGACHAMDLPFSFDNLDAPGVDVLLGPERDAGSAALARLVADAWVAFAATGDPRSDERLAGWSPAAPAAPAGTDPAPPRPVAVLDRAVEVLPEPLADRYRLWSGTLWP